MADQANEETDQAKVALLRALLATAPMPDKAQKKPRSTWCERCRDTFDTADSYGDT